MAGASMNDIKARMKSVESTMQITKAMELVATSKLRRAKEKVERSRPFCQILGDAIESIKNINEMSVTPWFEKRDTGAHLFIVIAGDRGLAGGYNANVFRITEVLAKGKNAIYLPVGKKALEYYRHRDANLLSESYGLVAEVSVGDTLGIAELVSEGFASDKFDSVYVVYTKFVSMISQTPVYEQLLPLDRDPAAEKSNIEPIYAGDPEEILNKILPQYVGGVIYSTVCEALASESAARRTAMNAANKNASEIIDTLVLKYNRARQAVITQEITEIVSGSEAL